MEIKTTGEIINIEQISLKLIQKKWVVVDDLIEMLRDWNCRNNPEIKRTINTIIMRIKDCQK